MIGSDFRTLARCVSAHILGMRVGVDRWVPVAWRLAAGSCFRAERFHAKFCGNKFSEKSKKELAIDPPPGLFSRQAEQERKSSAFTKQNEQRTKHT